MNIFLKRIAQSIFHAGNVAMTDAAGTVHRFGDGRGTPVHLRFNTAAAERAVAFDPTLKLAECYMNGEIDMVEGTIYDFLEAVFTNAGESAGEDGPWLKALAWLRFLTRPLAQYNTSRRARANAHHHYDLSGALYDLFLDSDRQYSCAYFPDEDTDLETAQRLKKRHIAAKLVIGQPGLSILDIGSGWGGLGLYLARYLGGEVTGVTLSDEQYGFSNERAKREGLADHARFLLKDYRNLEEPVDRIVSVGMFEHVGRYHYDTFFAKAARLLKPDGVMLLHTIGRSSGPSYTNPFIKKHIFPGGYIPSLSEISTSVEKSGLVITDIEVLRLHYAHTLRIWRERFMARREEAKALYDERFCRMWEFYLAASESAFRWQGLVVFQIQMAHKIDAVPTVRRYVEEAERELEELERQQSGGRKKMAS